MVKQFQGKIPVVVMKAQGLHKRRAEGKDGGRSAAMNMVEETIDPALAQFRNDPPDTQFQREYHQFFIDLKTYLQAKYNFR